MSEKIVSREKIKSFAESAGAIALLGTIWIGGPYVAVSDSNMDLLGDGHRTRPQEEVEEIALDQVDALYSDASPSEQYAMLFLNNGYGANFDVGRLEGGNGLLGLIDFIAERRDQRDLQVHIGQGCLAGSSYDTLPSEFDSRGIFHSVRGEISAIAAANANEDGTLTIVPAATNAAPLQLTKSIDDLYRPVDAVSERILQTYGCEPTKLVELD